MTPRAVYWRSQDFEFPRVDGRMFLGPASRIKGPDDHHEDRKQTGEKKRRAPPPSLHCSSKHDGREYSPCANSAKQQTAADAPLSLRHPIGDHLVRIGVACGFARSGKESNRHKGPREMQPRTLASCQWDQSHQNRQRGPPQDRKSECSAGTIAIPRPSTRYLKQGISKCERSEDPSHDFVRKVKLFLKKLSRDSEI